jgi:hypothetical protein
MQSALYKSSPSMSDTHQQVQFLYQRQSGAKRTRLRRLRWGRLAVTWARRSPYTVQGTPTLLRLSRLTRAHLFASCRSGVCSTLRRFCESILCPNFHQVPEILLVQNEPNVANNPPTFTTGSPPGIMWTCDQNTDTRGPLVPMQGQRRR